MFSPLQMGTNHMLGVDNYGQTSWWTNTQNHRSIDISTITDNSNSEMIE